MARGGPTARVIATLESGAGCSRFEGARVSAGAAAVWSLSRNAIAVPVPSAISAQMTTAPTIRVRR